ncbi:polysaccharide biosynthesis C-terminal domain-containing protein [Reichenbachiella agarivorans]|uniref:Polysaccharide biosynthesis C-terminal domain-containing protein n=1 Tax=Reichenbachiella agarivorans TaxID=2979464 RepID=A0ABY6CY85_9BACT|nr:polysaccharide biosynthesis C-terminal domain-containing protein [Reichenbachiella agarivorans]UXP33180.1 polysaccharide biosynthesis C-terminal domain-containing protein [Reichenbachiella agarivorans]
MAGLRGLAGDTMWYGLSSIVGRLINYLLVPLYTAVFALGEYGIVTELYAYIGFFYVIYTYGMETAYFRFATKGEDEKSIFNTSFSAILTSSFLFSVILVIFSSDIAAILGYEGKEVVIYWLAAIIAIDAIVSIPYARLRLQKKAKKFAFIKLFQVILIIVLNLFFYLLCYKIYQGVWFPEAKSIVDSFFDEEFKVKYVFLSNMVANALVLVLLSKELKDFNFTLKFDQLKPLLAYALPLLIMGLAGITNEMLSRALLKEWLPDNFYPGQSSLAALGVFGACYKLSVFMLLGIQAFRYAAEPFFFSEASNKNSPVLFAKIMSGFIALNAIVFMAVSVNLEPIGMVFLRNPEYREGLYIVPFLLLGYLFHGIYYNLSVWYKITDQTKYGAIITGFGAVMTVVLNYILIPIMGYFGSALATLLTFFVMTVINFVLGQKHFPVPYDVAKAAEYLLVSSVAVWLLFNLDAGHWALNFLIKNASVLLFVTYIYLRERKHLAGRIIFGYKLP